MDTDQQLIKLESLFMNIKDGVQICKLDDNFTIIYMNNEFCNLVGYAREEIKTLFNNQYTALLPHNEIESLMKNIKSQLKNESSFRIEHQIKTKDGSLIWVFVKGGLIKYTDGETYVQFVFTDVTSQKTIIEELKQKSFEIEVLTNNVEVAIISCEISKNYSVKYANDSLFNLIGYTREQFKSECENFLREIIYVDDRESLHKSLEEQLNKIGFSRNIYRMVKRDGSIIWVLERGTKSIDSNGEVEFHGVITDITQEEQNRQLLISKNEKLLLSEKRYEIAMENSKDIIFDYIIETKSIICENKTMENFINNCNLDKGIEGVIEIGIMHPNSIEEIRSLFRKIDEGAEHVTSEVTAIVEGAKEILFQVSLTNVFDESKRAIRAIGVIRNINEKRMLQSERKYRRAMTADKLYANELNITQDRIVSINSDWAKLTGIIKFTKVSQMVDYMCSNFVHPDFEKMYRDFFDKDKINSAFLSGQTHILVQYRIRDADNIYTWVESSMSIICDDITNDIKARLYIKDINQEKEKEIKSFEEKRFYKAMVSNSVIVYEVDITNNTIVCGNDQYSKLYKVIDTNNYTDTVNATIDKYIYHEDINYIKDIVLRENVIGKYESGQSKIFFEYRKICKNGDCIWMCCDAHLFQDPKTNDIKGFCYIQDINEKKVKELDLVYKAEHDTLTGFYNKGTVEKLINKYLESDEGKSGKHAFFIFDVDHFKSINDNFGHVFGDVILSRITQRMRDLFRDVDILGRIGGDEFVVLMKNIPGSNSALSKANEICKISRETYTKNGKQFNISISIGIAMYTTGTTTYSELYKCSDAALYQSKEHGRNQFFIYDSSMDSKVCDVESVQELDLIESKSFEKNISEYVFRILYESLDKKAAINDVFELIGKQYTISRCYIYEKSNDGMSINNTFQWCNKGVIPHIYEKNGIPCKLIENYVKKFDENEIFYLPNINRVNRDSKKLLVQNSIKSLLQFSILKNNEFIGFIGFDQCDFARKPSRKETTDLRNVANILGVFINEMRASEEKEVLKNSVVSIADSLGDYVYVIDNEQYKLKFVNNELSKIAPNAKIGEYCYKGIYNIDVPCKVCPITNTVEQGNHKDDIEVYNEHLNIWIKTSASLVNWTDGKKAFIVSNKDITKNKD